MLSYYLIYTKTHTMKINIVLFGLLGLLFLTYGCESDLKVEAPSLEIHDYSVVKIDEGHGDTIRRVVFQMKEDANIISFFSGQFGSDYKYKEGKINHLEKLEFSFETSSGYGAQDPLSQFSVLASPDFSGNYQIDSIYKATWIDITDRFDFSQLTTDNKDFTANGVVSIGDLLAEHQSLNLAFRYFTPNQRTHGVYAAIRIQNWLLNGESILFGRSELPLSWGLLEQGNLRAGRNALSASTITLRGNHGAMNSKDPEVIGWLEAETEAWVISQKINYKTDLGRDTPTPIKAFGDPKMTTFSFDYKEAGTYEVVFIASNATIEGQKQIEKRLTITIP